MAPPDRQRGPNLGQCWSINAAWGAVIMNRGEILARAVVDCRAFFVRYLDGFDEFNRTRQAPGLPNHVAWCLGHCALTMHRAAEKIDGQPLPAAHFLFKAMRGDAHHFGTESVSFNSRPTDDPAIYPGWSGCVAIFDAACARLVTASGTATDAKLDEQSRWGSTDVSLESLVWRMVFRNGTHCGQIIDLRRAFGLGSIFR